MKKNNILLIIDMQQGFLIKGYPLYIKGSNKLINKLNNYLLNYSNNFDAIIFTYDTHFKNTYHKQKESINFPLHCEYNTLQWDLVVDKHILSDIKTKVFFLKKDTYNCWNKKSAYNKNQNLFQNYYYQY